MGVLEDPKKDDVIYEQPLISPEKMSTEKSDYILDVFDGLGDGLN